MKFLRGVFARQEGPPKADFDGAAGKVCEDIWSLAGTDLGTIQHAGHTIPISLHLYGHARLKRETDKIQAARASRTPIDVPEAAQNMFISTLHMVAGRIEMHGGDLTQFQAIGTVLIGTYKQVIEPTALALQRGQNPPRISISVFEEMRRLPTPENWNLDALREEINEGLGPCIDFLNSYHNH